MAGFCTASMMQLRLRLATTIFALLVFFVPSSCGLQQRGMPRSLLEAPNRLAAAASATTSLSTANRVERFVLQHKPPTWGPNTLASSPGAAGTPVNVSYTLFYPAKASTLQQQQQQDKLPVLFLLNGANVEAEQYSTLAGLLNNRGYVFVASDYYQPLTKDIIARSSPTDPARNWTLPANCPRDKLLGPSAALIQTFLDHVKSQTPQDPTFKYIERRGIVLVGHSFGGAVSMDILGGRCSANGSDTGARNSFSYCEGYEPSLATRSCAAGKSSNSSSSSGGGDVTMGLIRGAVVYEGYRSAPAPPSAANDPAAVSFGTGVFLPAGEAVPPGMFLLLLASQYAAPKVQRAYQLTNVSSCSCSGMATFAGLNHFGINNYQPNTTAQGQRQLTPCGRAGSSDPVGFKVTAAHQNKQLQNMATLIDNFIKAELSADTSAKKQLQQLAANKSSNRDVGLQLRTQCLQ